MGKLVEDKLARVLSALGLTADLALYVYNDGKIMFWVATFVDDLVCLCNDESFCQKIFAGLGKEFNIKDLGSLSYCLASGCGDGCRHRH